MHSIQSGDQLIIGETIYTAYVSKSAAASYFIDDASNKNSAMHMTISKENQTHPPRLFHITKDNDRYYFEWNTGRLYRFNDEVQSQNTNSIVPKDVQELKEAIINDVQAPRC